MQQDLTCVFTCFCSLMGFLRFFSSQQEIRTLIRLPTCEDNLVLHSIYAAGNCCCRYCLIRFAFGSSYKEGIRIFQLQTEQAKLLIQSIHILYILAIGVLLDDLLVAEDLATAKTTSAASHMLQQQLLQPMYKQGDYLQDTHLLMKEQDKKFLKQVLRVLLCWVAWLPLL
ncbi:uncharacterized protein LOC131227271 isoform X2 [Magnolia sinica]|uniref:uncharacterized protein LOC131227271 isoform X2 n=1 Tax=Magnolia sinica TaxID=86752 RepID=UPI002658A241|nr:uncharacterized protein LOC131227271 isoform X2 [Magnolia sinica]